MAFIILLVATTTSIAGSAAYFSVYGLANTFSGTFWSVVIMGASLEAGKLVGASYLYRYWGKLRGLGGTLLKTYMILGVLALMFLTSAGIFGYLSSGYQADVLPLKQLNEEINLLDQERTRALERKKQIDEQIAKGPIVSDVKTTDTNAARVLRESTKSRESINKQFKVEQEQLTKRISELDANLLDKRTKVIKTEAHIGPITYIAKAFGYETDYATKLLIFIIIFAFDPMAIALTLGVNIALRLRGEEKNTDKAEPVPSIVEKIVEIEKPVEVIKEVPVDREVIKEVEKEVIKEVPVEVEKIVEVPVEKIVEKEVIKEVEVEKIVEVPVEKIVEKEVIKEVPVDRVVEKIVYVDKPVEVPVEVEKIVYVDKRVEVPVEKIVYVDKLVEVPAPRRRSNLPSAIPDNAWKINAGSGQNLKELLDLYRELKDIEDPTDQEQSDLIQLKELLTKHGMGLYL